MATSRLIVFWLATMLKTSGIVLAQHELVVNLTSTSLHTFPSNYTNSTKLILNNNLIELSLLDQEALGSYLNLEELHLDSNKVHALLKNLFPRLPQLKVLSLSGNNLTEVGPDAFTNLTDLASLDLSHNALKVLPPEAFRGLPKLVFLQLQGNRLETLGGLAELRQLQSIDMDANPWNCSCSFLKEVRSMNASGVQINGSNAVCATPEVLAKRNILFADADCLSGSSASAVPTPNTARSPTQHITHLPLGQTKPANISKNHGPLGGDSGLPVVGQTWKFLVAVLVIALGTSALIVCAVKSPSWYKLLFNYRHQRLREEEEPPVFSTGRYSNFSLATQQTEVTARELEVDLEDYEEDGYIEDRYIETGDYDDATVDGEL